MSEFDFEANKKLLIANLQKLKSFGVEEFTLQKKWDELQNKIYSHRLVVHVARHMIWEPEEIQNEEQTIGEIQAMQPKVILATNKNYSSWWNLFRVHGSSAEYNQPPTRHIRFFVVDASSHRGAFGLISGDDKTGSLMAPPSGRILGIGAISGDLHTITCRDEFIGWTAEQRNSRLRYSAVGSTIVPTQPFGSNFLGGKLIAALTTSALLRNEWQMQYGDVLAGMTTTSLYGRPSIYDDIKTKIDGKNEYWWEAVGDATGSIPIQPDDAIFAKWKHYVKKSHPEEYKAATQQKEDVNGPVTGETMRVFSLICRVAGIRLGDFKHGHERGVYYSSFYRNTKEFLRGEITEDKLVLKPLLERDTQAILDWWRPAAIKRYKKLKEQGKLKPDKLFYNHGYLKDYETFKAHHLKHIGN